MESKQLKNLPEEFKEIFKKTSARLHEYGDIFLLTELSFMTTMIVFSTEIEEDKIKHVDECRKLICKAFDNEEFVKKQADYISENHQGLLEKLYRQGIIYLWTSLESFIKDLIIALIEYDDRYLSNDELKKINIPMADYFSYNDEDKILFLADLILEKTNSAHKRGVNKFEGYLKPFNLDGSLDSNHKSNIFYLQQIRNCIVHNDSIVDKKFYENCKQLGYEIGDEIKINFQQFREYEISIMAYIMKVFNRLNRNFGAPDKFLDTLKERYEALFK